MELEKRIRHSKARKASECFRSKFQNSFHDLDDLAGTWSREDKKTFDKKTKSFEKIDKELWQ